MSLHTSNYSGRAFFFFFCLLRPSGGLHGFGTFGHPPIIIIIIIIFLFSYFVLTFFFLGKIEMFWTYVSSPKKKKKAGKMYSSQ
jgi:hypothetical protein